MAESRASSGVLKRGREGSGETPPTPVPAWWLAPMAGLCGALSFQPLQWAFLVPLAPLGLFLAARSASSARRALLRVLWGAFIFYFGAIHWLCSLYHYHPLAPAGIAFVGFYMALYPALAAYGLRRWLWNAGLWWQFSVWSAAWLLFEWVRTLGRLAMPFTLISHAWLRWPSLVQGAAVAGELGVSLQLLLVSAAILAALLAVLPEDSVWRGKLGLVDAGLATVRRLHKRVFIASAGLVAVILSVSVLRFHSWDAAASPGPDKDEKRLRVAIVQPNIDQFTKMNSYMHPDPAVREELQERANQIHEAILGGMRERPDLIVMPETTFSSLDFIGDYGLHRRIEAMLRPLGADIFFGADRVVFDDMGNPIEFYNSSYFVPFGATVREAANQDKMRLVPFGEHLPYFDLIPFFNSTLVQIASFDEGKQITIFESHGWKFGALICFESTFGLQARRITARGANFLCVITNDAWYRWSPGDGPHWSAGPAQHHALSVMRAIETRRPVLRAANTGISSIIAPNGRLLESLPLAERGALRGEIAPQVSLTPYVRLGNTPLVLVCLVVIVAGGIGAHRARASASQDHPPTHFAKAHEGQ